MAERSDPASDDPLMDRAGLNVIGIRTVITT